jgi:hypothetical protein
MVVIDPLVTETSTFWQNHGESNDVDPSTQAANHFVFVREGRDRVKALADIASDFAVIHHVEALVTETSTFWQNHGESNDVDPSTIQTEVFRLPSTRIDNHHILQLAQAANHFVFVREGRDRVKALADIASRRGGAKRERLGL